jgi:hypothetical protein
MPEIESPITEIIPPTHVPSPISEPNTLEINTNIVSNIVEQSLVDLVKKSLENNEMKKKTTITLTPELTSVINNIISLTPNTLTDIEKATIEIIKDGKIDSNDIPNLIVVVQKIYQFIYSLKSKKLDAKKRAEITGELLKYLIHLLVLERKIKIDEDPEKIYKFYSEVNVLIDSCVELLSYSKILKTKGCFKKIFG